MRVVSGKARGMILKTIESNTTRPTKDMVKEALFSIIMDKIKDSIFLDLFAGSGAIGIEAISRGASKVYFSDINKECIDVINQNIKKAKFEKESIVIKGDYTEVLKDISKEKFDLIYIDPPYNKGLGKNAIEMIFDLNLLKSDGLIIYETDYIEEAEDKIKGYNKFNYRKYGRNILNFYN